MPIRLSYGPVGALGQLAVSAGEGEDFWRRHQAGQQQIAQQQQHNLQEAALRSQNTMQNNALMAAYNNRPGAGGTNASIVGPGAPQSVQPETLRLQESIAAINEAFKRGSIDQETRDRMEIATRGGSSTLGNIGINDDPNAISHSQQRLLGNDQFDRQMQALKIAESMAKSRANQFLDAIPGGLLAMDDAQRKQYKALAGEVESAQAEQQKLLKASGAGLIAGASGAPAPAGGGGSAPRIRNPKTGEILELRNNDWVPVK